MTEKGIEDYEYLGTYARKASSHASSYCCNWHDALHYSYWGQTCCSNTCLYLDTAGDRHAAVLSSPMQGSHSWHADRTFKVRFRIMPQTENRQKDFDAHCMNM